MYNACYGGFSFSQSAAEEYSKRTGANGHTTVDRTDPVMIDICKMMGSNADGLFSSIKIAYIPYQYKEHFLIAEYDGYETVNIDYNGYTLDKITDVLHAESISNDTKIQTMLEILATRSSELAKLQ